MNDKNIDDSKTANNNNKRDGENPFLFLFYKENAPTCHPTVR